MQRQLREKIFAFLKSLTDYLHGRGAIIQDINRIFTTLQQILDDFKKNKRDIADFWLTLRGRFIHIRYFTVRDNNENYRGTLEVSQDVTEIRELKGQKRILDPL